MDIATIVGGSGGVGATTLAARLMRTLTRSDLRVLVLDADLGCGDLDERLLGIRSPIGLGHIVVGSASLREAMFAISERAWIVAAGGYPDPTRPLEPAEEIQLLTQIPAIAPEIDLMIVDAGRTPHIDFFAALAKYIVFVMTPCGNTRRKTADTLMALTARRRKTPIHIYVNRCHDQQHGLQAFAELAGMMDPARCAELQFLDTFPFDAQLEGPSHTHHEASEQAVFGNSSATTIQLLTSVCGQHAANSLGCLLGLLK